MSCSSLKNNTNDVQLEKLGLIEIQSNKTYISKLIETISKMLLTFIKPKTLLKKNIL